MSRFGDTLASRGIDDPRVLAAMETVPRERFVELRYRLQANADQPLPIGMGQTISQPYVIALMTQTLQLDPRARVLEIGTGCGYQTAILAEIALEVYSVERIALLQQAARERLQALGYRNIYLKLGDGYEGWQEHGPYDAIIVTCAPDHVPAPLIDQLANGGRMMIPVGSEGGPQYLTLVTRRGEHIQRERMAAVAFVPLVSGSSGIPY